jgi:hypothetical protein
VVKSALVVAFPNSTVPKVLDAELKFCKVEEPSAVREDAPMLILPKPGAIDPEASAPTVVTFESVVRLLSVADRARQRKRFGWFAV